MIFSNGINQREITHSANEFVITIPRKSEQVTNQANLVTDPVQTKNDPVSDQALGDIDPAQAKTDPAQAKTDPVSNQALGDTDLAQAKTDPVSDQAARDTTKLKLSKKQQDIRNYCTVPRNRQEILQRVGVTDHFDNRKKYIYDLVEAGVLERTIPDKPNDRNQKYRRKQ